MRPKTNGSDAVPQQRPTPAEQTPDDSPTAGGTDSVYADSNGYGFDVPAGYSVAHNVTAQFEQWIVTTDVANDEPVSLPELIVLSAPGTTALPDETDVTISKTEKISQHGLSGTKYTVAENEGQCPLYEFIVDGRTYRISLYECLDSKIFDQVAQSFRKTSTQPTTDSSASAPFVLRVGESYKLMGGGAVTLDKINDSRCKPGVQCIWEGELAAEVRYMDASGVITRTTLGLRTKTCHKGLKLESITESNATFMKAISCE